MRKVNTPKLLQSSLFLKCSTPFTSAKHLLWALMGHVRKCNITVVDASQSFFPEQHVSSCHHHKRAQHILAVQLPQWRN